LFNRPLAAATTALIACTLHAPTSIAQDIDYPTTRTVDHVDEYHGTKVADPYRWLEDDVRESEQVADWVRRQNEVTFGYLESLPQREAIRGRVEDLWDYERYSTPSKIAGFYVYAKNDGLQNHSVYYKVDTLDDEPEVLLDPNAWSDDGTVSLRGLSFSEDGRYMAYAKSVAGSDWSRWFVRDMRTGQDLADEINWTKWGGVSWTHDNKGFFYSRFPEPAPGQKFQATNLNSAIYYHRLGTPQSDDTLVWNNPAEPRC
jgi:prolyl oligopeptidase